MPNTPPPIGSHDDIYNRLIAQLPKWFGSVHPDLDFQLEAYITTLIFNYQQYQYVSLQQRLQTATDVNLDLFSQDYLGDTLPRRLNEGDNSYRNRIKATLLQEKATRPGMSNALFILTGFLPILFEPWYPSDCGAYNVPSTLAYSTFGKYGSGSYPYQGFIDVYVSQYQGMASYSGYNNYFFGYNASGGNADGWYGGNSIQTAIISDQDIYDLINLTKAEGITCWVSIHRTAT